MIKKDKKYVHLLHEDSCKIMEIQENDHLKPVGSISIKEALNQLGFMKHIKINQSVELSFFNPRFNVKELKSNKNIVSVMLEYAPSTYHVQLIEKSLDIKMPWIYMFARFNMLPSGKLTTIRHDRYYDTSYFMSKNQIDNTKEKLLCHIPLPNSWPDSKGNICWGGEKPKIKSNNPVDATHDLFKQVMTSHFSSAYMPIYVSEKNNGNNEVQNLKVSQKEAIEWYYKWSEHIESGKIWDIIRFKYSVEEVTK